MYYKRKEFDKNFLEFLGVNPNKKYFYNYLEKKLREKLKPYKMKYDYYYKKIPSQWIKKFLCSNINNINYTFRLGPNDFKKIVRRFVIKKTPMQNIKIRKLRNIKFKPEIITIDL